MKCHASSRTRGNVNTRSLAQLVGPLCAAALFFAATAAAAEQAVPELRAAQDAIQRAADGDADQYAPDLIQAARTGLAQAQAAAMDRYQRRQVPWLAQRATVDADLAYARSNQAKAQARVAQAQQDLIQLRRTLSMPAEQPAP